MEIYGILPFPESILNERNINCKLIKDQLTVVGASTEIKNVWSCVVGIKLYVKSIVPNGDPAIDEENPQEYDKTVYTTSAVTIRTNDNLDVLSITNFTLVDYDTGNPIIVNFNDLSTNDTNRITILNYMEAAGDIGDIKAIIDSILEDLKKIKLPEFGSDIYTLTDGDLVKLEETNSLGQLISKKRWEGTLPLDTLINVISKNLDLLVEEQKLKGDNYAVYYVQLFQAAMQIACDLEKFRWTLISENFIKLLNLKMQVLSTLADFQVKQLNLANLKAQTRVMMAQYRGFGANNKQKVLTTQIEGATSAFAAGMTETPPPIYNNSELMQLYTSSKSDMDEIL